MRCPTVLLYLAGAMCLLAAPDYPLQPVPFTSVRFTGGLLAARQATNTAVMVTEEGSKGAEAGMALVEEAGASIRELSATLEEAAQSAAQIAASVHQQTNGMEQLTTAMHHIKQAATQTAASSLQTEQSVNDLLEMAKRLNDAAARYAL